MGGGREMGSEVSLRKKGGVEKCALTFGFISFYPTLAWLVTNQNNFVKLTVTGQWSLPALILTLEPYVVSSFHRPAEKGSESGTCENPVSSHSQPTTQILEGKIHKEICRNKLTISKPEP